MSDDEPVQVVWNQVYALGELREHWRASLVKPFRSRDFALVMRSGEAWRVEVFPRGRIGIGLPVHHATFRGKDRAQRCVERWARYHWQAIERWPGQ